MKKLLSVLLAVLMLISIAPINAYAASKPNRSDSELTVYDGNAKKYYHLFDELGYHKSGLKGLSYSLDSNTLTLSSIKNSKLRIDATEMGTKFKIKVNGTCEIGRLNVLFGGLTLTGYGTLTVNKSKKNDYAIMGDSISPFTVDKNVTLKLYAKKYVLHLTYCKKDIFKFKNGNAPKITSKPTETEKIYGYVDAEGSTGYKTLCDLSPSNSFFGAQESYVTEKNGYPEQEYNVYKYFYSPTLNRYFKDEYSTEPEAFGTYDELKLQGYEIQEEGGKFIENDFNETHYIQRSVAVDSKKQKYAYDSNGNVYDIIEIPELYNHYHIWEDEGAHEYLPYGISDVFYFKKNSKVKLENLTKIYNTDLDSYHHTIKKTSYVYVGKPKETSVSKVTATRGGFKANWKKVSGISGYQIQYATNSKFTKNKKTVKVSKSSTSKTVSKLKRKKTYYIRIRTYKTLNGKTYYSSWSKAKKIKTK